MKRPTKKIVFFLSASVLVASQLRAANTSVEQICHCPPEYAGKPLSLVQASTLQSGPVVCCFYKGIGIQYCVRTSKSPSDAVIAPSVWVLLNGTPDVILNCVPGDVVTSTVGPTAPSIGCEFYAPSCQPIRVRP